MSDIPATMLRSALLGRYGRFVRQYEAPSRYHHEDERREVEIGELVSAYQEQVAERIRAARYVAPATKLVFTVLKFEDKGA